MDNIYDTLAKLNRVANRPEAKKIVKEDSHGMMKKGLKDFIRKQKDKSGYDKAAVDASKMNQKYKPFGKGDSDYVDGLPKKKKDDKMSEGYYDQKPIPDKTMARNIQRIFKDMSYLHWEDLNFFSSSLMNMDPGDKYDAIQDIYSAMYNAMGAASKMTGERRPDNFGQQIQFPEKLHGLLQPVIKKAIEAFSGKTDIDEADNTDRSSVTLDMVAPALKKLHMGYKEKADEYYTAYDEMKADGMSDEEIMNADDDIVGYVNIDDIEDKIKAIEEVFKEGNFGKVNGNNIIAMASSGDTAMRELFMQELKYAIKDNHPEVYSKLFMYGIGESMNEAELVEKESDQKNESSGGTLKDAARAGVMARLAELAGLPAQEIEEALGDSPEDTASRIMSEVSLDEEDTNEGNEFSGALEDAKKNGKAEFTVDGKKYKVEAIDSDEDAIQEADDDSMPSMKEMQGCVDEGMTEDEICEKYSSCDEGKIKLMASKCGKMNEGGGRDMECGHCDGTGKHGDKDCKKCDGTGEAQDDDDPMNNESKVEETTSAGAVADGAGSGSSPYKNASVYESNEIVKRARQLNEDMSFTVTGGPDQEPTLNINASGEEAQQLAQLLKLSGLAMTAQQPSYGEVEIQVAEDQEFANGDQNEQTADTNTLVNAISGGLNGQKKMAYPKVAGGDNPMSGLLGESELVATSANQLLKQYEAYKAK